jgi:hypothetical protein
LRTRHELYGCAKRIAHGPAQQAAGISILNSRAPLSLTVQMDISRRRWCDLESQAS